MPEPWTFKGEMQRGWRRFRALRTRWQVVAWVVVAFIAISIISAAGGGSSDEKSKPASRDAEAPTKAPEATKDASIARATDTPKPTTAPTDTATPKPPTNTPEPTATSAPLTFEQQIEKSYRDNKGFMARATTDGIQIEWFPSPRGFLRIDLHPKSLLSEGDALTVAGASAIVASRAIWTTYPDVQQIQVSVFTEFTLATGAKEDLSAAQSTISRATGEKFQYDGLRDRAGTDNKLWFCGADKYGFAPAFYAALKDKGCLLAWGISK